MWKMGIVRVNKTATRKVVSFQIRPSKQHACQTGILQIVRSTMTGLTDLLWCPQRKPYFYNPPQILRVCGPHSLFPNTMVKLGDFFNFKSGC